METGRVKDRLPQAARELAEALRQDAVERLSAGGFENLPEDAVSASVVETEQGAEIALSVNPAYFEGTELSDHSVLADTLESAAPLAAWAFGSLFR